MIADHLITIVIFLYPGLFYFYVDYAISAIILDIL
jgi:hypothetical protein